MCAMVAAAAPRVTASATTKTPPRGAARCGRSATPTLRSSTGSVEMTTLADQIRQANDSARTPVVFIHGLWLLAGSWDRWATVFEQAGYAPVQPGWPDDPESIAEANAHPEVFAGKTVGRVAEHFANVIARLKQKPAVVRHSLV